MTTTHDMSCDWCGSDLSKKGKRWVGLNRHVVNCEHGWVMVSCEGDGDDYKWDQHDSRYTCSMLCYPDCLLTWIEGEIIELSGKFRKKP